VTPPRPIHYIFDPAGKGPTPLLARVREFVRARFSVLVAVLAILGIVALLSSTPVRLPADRSMGGVPVPQAFQEKP
jgi:hypothetical protein